MKTRKELLSVEGGSILIVRVVEGKSERPHSLIADQLGPYTYAAKPYAATLIDITLGGYFISSTDLGAMVMSLPPGSGQRPACAVVATKEDTARVKELLNITKLASFILVFTSLDEALDTLKSGVANCTPGLPALFVQSSRAAPSAHEGRAQSTPQLPVAEAPASSVLSSSGITSPRVFLAHASEDKEAIRHLHLQLTDRGFQPWLDEVDLTPGKNWRIEITEAINRCDIFLACLSKSSVGKRGYVQREFRMALSAYSERPPGTIYLIPVRLDDCEVPDLQIFELGVRLQDIQWLDLWKVGGIEKLVDAIWAATTTPNRPQRAPVKPGVRIVDVLFVERIREQSPQSPVYLDRFPK